MRTEVVIIGAGPAGASVARSLSAKGIENILVDRRNTAGIPVQCAEFVGLNINQYLNLTLIPSVVNQRISFMDVDTDKHVYRFEGKGYMINRDIFDDYIVKSAVKLGTGLLGRTHVLKVYPVENTVMALDTFNNQSIEIHYDYLVVATGPKNNLNLDGDFRLGLKNKSYIFATQVKTDLLKDMPDSVLCCFRPYIPYGYGWIFPKGKFANVGIGIEKSEINMPILDSLDSFLKEMRDKGFIGANIYGKTSGLVPVSGLNNLCSGNIALCGDAGGLTHPITGAGILNSVMSGGLLGDYIAESIKSSTNFLEEYREEMEFIFSRSLSNASKKRYKLYPLMTNKNAIDECIKSLWPSFEGYYE